MLTYSNKSHRLKHGCCYISVIRSLKLLSYFFSLWEETGEMLFFIKIRERSRKIHIY